MNKGHLTQTIRWSDIGSPKNAGTYTFQDCSIQVNYGLIMQAAYIAGDPRVFLIRHPDEDDENFWVAAFFFAEDEI